VEELETILKLWNRIYEYLQTGEDFLITGDHGLTWRKLHKKIIDLPKGAKNPHRGGRVAQIEYLSEEILKGEIWKSDRNDKYICLTKHGLFKGGRKIFYGEGHGGALPEEILVPIIEVFPTKIAFNFKLITSHYKLSPKNEIEVKLKIIPTPDKKVKILLNDKIYTLDKKEDFYHGIIKDLFPGSHEIEILVGNKSIGKTVINVSPSPFVEEDLGI